MPILFLAQLYWFKCVMGGWSAKRSNRGTLRVCRQLLLQQTRSGIASAGDSDISCHNGLSVRWFRCHQVKTTRGTARRWCFCSSHDGYHTQLSELPGTWHVAAAAVFTYLYINRTYSYSTGTNIWIPGDVKVTSMACNKCACYDTSGGLAMHSA